MKALKQSAKELVNSVNDGFEEQRMLDRARKLFNSCIPGDRPNEVMENCIRIAIDELPNDFTIRLIKSCNAYDITITDYIKDQAKYLLKLITTDMMNKLL